MAKGWEIRVRGLVQGVGLRPFVWKLANEMDLSGEVLNDAEGVLVRLKCTKEQLTDFQNRLHRNVPPLARIDSLEVAPMENGQWEGFQIVASKLGDVTTGIVPDAATCPDCLADIGNPENRRYGYAFTNCTNCGPRLSITGAIPYDRGNTSMAAFEMCPACQAEYSDPTDRRFHAQPNACPDCGPHLWLQDQQGPRPGDPIIETAKALKAGKIVAIKGLGGFQLAADAGNKDAVATLRRRKHRRAKPLACMARDLKMARDYTALSDGVTKALIGPQAPIVLAPIRGNALADNVAPDQNRLGIMLPNTPLHHLLMAQMERPIVMTSGNLSNQPQVSDNDAALQKLASIADLWLLHDRDIVNRVDDSVVQTAGDTTQIMRRARGYAPAPVRLHPDFAKAPAILAVGADLKNTFCLLKDGQAIVSQHMGDMDNPETQRDFKDNLELYRQIYKISPTCIATDLHPGYFSTRLGQQLAAEAGGKLNPVQHHHAHIAAVMAEHGFGPDQEPVLGIVLDGLGHGADGSLWGGEFLLANFHGFQRVAHFLPVALPGGDKANTQPWRNAVAHLLAAFGPQAMDDLGRKYGGLPCLKALNAQPVAFLAQLIDQGVNAPLAASAGRLFDAVAAVLGICFEAVEFEGQAAMRLQAMAENCPNETGYYPLEPKTVLDWLPVWEGIFGDLENNTPLDTIAARFHNSLIRVISSSATRIARIHGADTVVLSGGVIQNTLLLDGLEKRITQQGLRVLTPRLFPPNDAGIALGQAVIAACRGQ